jgi:regulator of sigma E protease
MNVGSFAVTLLSFVVALGVLVFVHELGHFLVAKKVGVLVQRFSIGFGPVIFSRRRGETEYAVSAVPLGGYVKMLGEDDEDEAHVDPARAFSTQPVARRAAIVFAGPAMNLVFAFVAYALLFTTVGVDMPSNEPRVGGVSAGLPAERAGLRAGDRIVEIDGESIETWEELSKRIVGSKGARLRLTVERDGSRFPLEITPELQPNRTINGETGESYRIGIEISHDWEHVGPVRAVVMAAEQTWGMSVVIVKGLGLILTGRVSASELGGPIAIARAAGQQARAGLRYFMSMLAFLSVNLAVLNLLPVPMLDGGHLFFFAAEAIFRRPVAVRVREVAQQVGLFLLVSLMLFAVYNDIYRWIQG